MNSSTRKLSRLPPSSSSPPKPYKIDSIHNTETEITIQTYQSTMAAMFMTKSVFFNLSKSLPQTCSSLSLCSSRKVSRVCFSAVSNYNYNEGRDPVDRTKERAEEMKEKAKEKTKEGTDRASETAKSAKETAEDYANDTKEKAKEGTQRAADAARDTKEKAKEYAQGVKGKTEEAAKTAAEKAEEGKKEAAGSAESLGEKAKQTVQGVFGAAKETTQKIKETVVGKDDKDDREKKMDGDVEEMRRRAGERDEKKNNKYN
ncbi:hypothetical protein EZV62_026722 [Acer yangbiense]|uniref:Uncharacterized protein n=1 Tax=Acer yangbiense TaxID=1000413 RepID=A0A5C7GRT8_9ROSI|nr:hypothetical protein EZV62_026722 [Acer yangbiense]